MEKVDLVEVRQLPHRCKILQVQTLENMYLSRKMGIDAGTKQSDRYRTS
jgi:hypothetical protein